MTHAQEIENFVRSSFDQYGIPYTSILGVQEFDDGHFEDTPIAFGDNIIMENVEKSAIALGVSKEAILNMDDGVVDAWIKRFPYFVSAYKYKIFREAAKFSKDDEPIFLLQSFLGNRNSISEKDFSVKYDVAKIKRRLIGLLKSYDKEMPGAYHEGAEITNLRVRTATICHFPSGREMFSQYADMIDTFLSLFYKAFDADLLPSEISEYNFLSSVLGVYDISYPKSKGNLYYDMLKKFIPIYKQEGYSEWYYYINFSLSHTLSPYGCAEFLDDKNLVKRFCDFYPEMKKEMRKFSLLLSKFECEFVWSDAKPIMLSEEEELEMQKTEFYVPISERALEPTLVYVDKTKSELSDDVKYFDILHTLSGPEKYGGIAISSIPAVPRSALNGNINRLIARFEALREGTK